VSSIGTPPTPDLHAISVGALGTLTLAVMAHTRLLLRHRDANASPVVHRVAIPVSGAELARLAPALPGIGGHTTAGLVTAAALWATALATLFAVLVPATVR